MMNRRAFILSAFAASLSLPALATTTLATTTLPTTALPAASLPRATVHKDPLCGCCGAWVDHLIEAGFSVDVIETSALNRVKTRLGVPGHLASCHTAEIDGYVIEGHVPAGAIKRLLAERPEASGLSVPGMPIGSPGMEVPGMADDSYDVVLFGPNGESAFAHYRGGELIPS